MQQSALLKNVSHLSLEPNPVLVEDAKQRAESVQNRIADKITAFSGSMWFVYIHIIWFGCWIGLGVEKYPYGLLTMIVSLEAIFLSCFVLISQNRQAAKEKFRSDVEYEANIRAGLEVTQLHVKVDALYDQILSRLATLETKVSGKPAEKAAPTEPQSRSA